MSLLLLLALSAPTAHAGRNAIAGQVFDRNGQPVNRAIVALRPGNVELVTDRQGRFLIDYLRDEDGSRTRLARKTDYALEVFKPGYHVHTVDLFFKRGAVDLPAITLVEETITVEDQAENLDPGLYKDPTHAAGANYEGQ